MRMVPSSLTRPYLHSVQIPPLQVAFCIIQYVVNVSYLQSSNYSRFGVLVHANENLKYWLLALWMQRCRLGVWREGKKNSLASFSSAFFLLTWTRNMSKVDFNHTYTKFARPWQVLQRCSITMETWITWDNGGMWSLDLLWHQFISSGLNSKDQFLINYSLGSIDREKWILCYLKEVFSSQFIPWDSRHKSSSSVHWHIIGALQNHCVLFNKILSLWSRY